MVVIITRLFIVNLYLFNLFLKPAVLGGVGETQRLALGGGGEAQREVVPRPLVAAGGPVTKIISGDEKEIMGGGGTGGRIWDLEQVEGEILGSGGAGGGFGNGGGGAC